MSHRVEKSIRIRIRLIGGLFLLGFLLVGFRAFDLQVLHGGEWLERAEKQHQKIVSLTPQRGTIYDRNGEELAVSIDVDSIFAEPRKIEDRGDASRQLAKALDLPAETVAARLKGNRNFTWLKRQVSPQQSEAAQGLGIDGVHRIKEPRRFYPNSGVAAHLLGFTGLDPKGLEGLELFYDQALLGSGGFLVTERDALGRGLGAGVPEIQGASRGHDLYLTLDKNLQYIVERELAAGIEAADARAGTVVVLEPATGKILAMASRPTYNPNAFARHEPAQWRNRAICDTFEPGSTFKIFLMAAALNEAVIKTSQRIDCENGRFHVGGKTIHDHKPYQKLTPLEIIKYSSNIGSAKIGKLLERESYYNYIRKFGFGSPTGIDLPGEQGGLVHDPNRWFEVDLAAISFGQGLTVTPLQMAAATAAIANDGYLMEPYVVEKIVDQQGQVRQTRQPRVVRKVVARDVAQVVTSMMESTTADGGTAVKAQVPGFRVAGKTGTAQKVDPVTGGYSADKRLASFVGFVPVEAPRLVILVTIDEPQKHVYGGLVAAPVFSRIAGQALQYLRIPPTRAVVPEQRQPTLEQFFNDLPQKQVVPIRSAGWEQGTEGPSMPDFHGMSYRQVLRLMEDRKLNLSFRGQGQVVEQSPPPGVGISYGMPAWVKLAPPG
ncbi:MAG TPA: penicillin-binding protein [Desulfuromonadales bacterium]|nr:penicillin-binding protein [Desulfuromonadales bacterium]